MKDLMSYLPKKKRDWVTSFTKDEEGYWLSVGEHYFIDDMGCRTIHEDTIFDVLRVLRSARPATDDELPSYNIN